MGETGQSGRNEGDLYSNPEGVGISRGRRIRLTREWPPAGLAEPLGLEAIGTLALLLNALVAAVSDSLAAAAGRESP